MSFARLLAVSKRRVRSFSRHFITIQSRSPRNNFTSLGASEERRAAVVDNSFSTSVASRVEGFGGSCSRIVRRIASIPEFINSCPSNGRPARQQLIKQHPQAVNIAARVNVQPAHFRLFRAHVGGRADELLELRINRLLRQLLLRRLGNAEINHLRHRRAVVQGHQDVRWLDVTMNDAFLMRVLDRMTNLDEQIQPVAGA